MSDIQRMSIQINGTKYPITTGEDPAYVEVLAREMDKAVRQLMQGGSLTVTEALVLLGLSYADAHAKAEETSDHLRGQIAGYLEDAAKARQETADARREIARLEKKLSGKEGKGDSQGKGQ